MLLCKGKGVWLMLSAIHNQCSGNGQQIASTFSVLPFRFWNLRRGGGRGGELRVHLPSSPYFITLIACKMVLRAASEDLQHLLLCANEYD